MNVVIYSRVDLKCDKEELKKLYNSITSCGFGFYVNTGFAGLLNDCAGITIEKNRIFNDHQDFPDNSDLFLCYGGDGTFLDGVRILDTRTVPILGINSGRLGFLANIPESHEIKVFDNIMQGSYITEERMLLKVSGDFGLNIEYPYAFNEFSIQKSGMVMISVDVYINGEAVTSYLGDGLILSTPSGSTAYSLSVGGPIIAPNSKCIMIAPIASHNLTMRPLVVPDDSIMELTVNSRNGDAVVTMDNRDYLVKNKASFTISKAEKTVFLAKFENNSFYRTLREKMMWGMDTRKFTK